MSTSTGKSRYIIRGGVEGRERLRILSRVMQPTTVALFRRVGVRRGMRCLDAGCGGGDAAFDLARIVGPEGSVVGADIDEIKLRIAREEAAAQQLANLEFRLADSDKEKFEREFDIVHARLLLTHLPNPARALENLISAAKPGGVVVVEDIDVSARFWYPENAAQKRLTELYTETVRRCGGDANIGPRLPIMLAHAGLERVQMNVVQPAGMAGDIKLISPLTMENIADAVLAENLATPAEIDQIVAELYDFAKRPGTVDSMPRVVEAWGWTPAGK